MQYFRQKYILTTVDRSPISKINHQNTNYIIAL